MAPCGTQTAERLSARRLAHSFADGPWSGVKLGSRGEISIDPSVEPITASAGGGAIVSISDPPTKQVYEGPQTLQPPGRVRGRGGGQHCSPA